MPPATAQHDIRRDHTFESIAGHDLPKALVRYMIDTDRLPHALLLHGPDEVGKTSFAWAAAKEILWDGLQPRDGEASTDGGADMFGGPSPEEIATDLEMKRRRLFGRVSREDTHPDVFSLAPSGAAGQIRVDDVRDFMDDHAYVTPVEGRRKVLVIERAETINIAAANTMLKVLEEPPSFLRFLLVTSQPHRMLETIRSRCALVRFQPLEEGELLTWLEREREGEAPDDLARAVRMSEGRPSRALDYLRNGAPIGGMADAMRDFHALGFPALFKTAEEIVAITADAQAALQALLQYFRDLMMVGMGQTELTADPDAAISAYRSLEAATNPAPPSVAALTAAAREIVEELECERNIVAREVQLEALLCRIGKAMRAAG